MSSILDKLRGGDRRSLGKANSVARDVQKNATLFDQVFAGFHDPDPVVRMRSADVIEKVTQTQPELLAGYCPEVINILKSADQQEICWHMAQIAPRLECSPEQEGQLIELLKNLLKHKSKIVQVSAMDSLAVFAERIPKIRKDITGIIKAQMEHGSPAILSRGRKLLERLE